MHYKLAQWLGPYVGDKQMAPLFSLSEATCREGQAALLLPEVESVQDRTRAREDFEGSECWLGLSSLDCNFCSC